MPPTSCTSLLLLAAGLRACVLANDECTAVHGEAGLVSGPPFFDNGLWTCWYLGPSFTSCSGEGQSPKSKVKAQGGCASAVTLTPPYDLSKVESSCKCCQGTLVSQVDSALFCELYDRATNKVAWNYSTNVLYYQYNVCSCKTCPHFTDGQAGPPGVPPFPANCVKLNDSVFAPCGEDLVVCPSRSAMGLPLRKFVSRYRKVIEKDIRKGKTKDYYRVNQRHLVQVPSKHDSLQPHPQMRRQGPCLQDTQADKTARIIEKICRLLQYYFNFSCW